MTNEKGAASSSGKKPVLTSNDGALAGTRIVYSEERKEQLLDSDEKEEPGQDKLIDDTSSNVSPEEEELLERAADFMPTEDEEGLHNAVLDDTDTEGDPLNENNEDISGKDLDIPGSEFDDAAEDIGEEDEENNSYSLGGDTYD